MKAFLAARKYEVVALGVGAVFAALHFATFDPVVGASTNFSLSRVVSNLEGRVTNALFQARGQRPAHPDVVVLEFDERGAQRFGLWPWPRDVVARIIEGVLDANPRVVGFDMAFTDEAANFDREREWLSALTAVPGLTPELETVKHQLEERVAKTPDSLLEAAFKRGGERIVQGTVPFRAADASDMSAETRARWAREIAPFVMATMPGEHALSVVYLDDVDAYSAYVGVNAPLARLSATGTSMAHFATVTDSDSAIRRAALMVRLKEPAGLFPALALAVAAKQLDARIVPVVDAHQLFGLRLVSSSDEVVIPVEGRERLTPINYPGSHDVFERVSAVDVVDGKVPAARLAGKAVLVGVTIVGSSGDQRVTPFSEFEGGVFTHAAVVSSILNKRFLSRPDDLVWAEVAAMVLVGLLIALAIPRIRAFRSKIAFLGVMAVGFFGLVVGSFSLGYRVSAVVPLAHLMVTAFGTIFLGYLSVDREKLKMRSTFSRYLGEDVMDVALENPDRLNRGEKREMTVLFSDIRGFTSLSEHMSPEKLADFINQYLSPMTQIVFDEKGTLDKYIGDAVMAFWNAPIDQSDHALRACRAAVHMLERLEELKAVWRQSGYPELEIGIGINTGQMVVGNMGSDVRVDYTVLGDSVNLGSRLEGTNKEYDTRIIISEWTRAAVKEGIVTRRLGAVRVKGKKVPVGIFELRGLGLPNETDAKAIAAFEAALVAWAARRFDDAETQFKAVLALWPNDTPTRNYLDELIELKASPPPPEWDGIVSLKTK